MRNIELRHTFPHLLPGRSLKNLVPGFVLALLAMPALAAEQSQGNVLTLGGGVDVAPRYSGSDKTRVSAAQVVEYAMANGFFYRHHARDRLRQQHRQPGLQRRAELSSWA